MAELGQFDPSLLKGIGPSKSNAFSSFARGFLPLIAQGLQRRAMHSQALDERAFETISFFVRSPEASDWQRVAALTVMSGLQDGTIQPKNAVKIFGDIQSKQAKPEHQKTFDRLMTQWQGIKDQIQEGPPGVQDVKGQGAGPQAAGPQMPLMGNMGGVPQPPSTVPSPVPGGPSTPPAGPAAQVATRTPGPTTPAGVGVGAPVGAPAPTPTPALAPVGPPPSPSRLTQQIQITDQGIARADGELQQYEAELARMRQMQPPSGMEQSWERMYTKRADMVKELRREVQSLRREQGANVRAQAGVLGAERGRAARERQFGEAQETRVELAGIASEERREISGLAAQQRERLAVLAQMGRLSAAETKEKKDLEKEIRQDQRDSYRDFTQERSRLLRPSRGGDAYEAQIAKIAGGKQDSVNATGFDSDQVRAVNEAWVHNYLIPAFDISPDTGSEMLSKLGLDAELLSNGDHEAITQLIRASVPSDWPKDAQLRAYRTMMSAFALGRSDVFVGGGKATQFTR